MTIPSQKKKKKEKEVKNQNATPNPKKQRVNSYDKRNMDTFFVPSL